MYKKQHFVDGNVLTAEDLNHIEDGISNISGIYYKSLAKAIEGINTGILIGDDADDSTAIAFVSQADNKTTITLVKDVEHSEQVSIEKNLNLILNGHCLSVACSGDNITVAHGATLSIDGTKAGSAIASDAKSKAAVLIRANGALNVKGGRYSITNGVGTTAAFASATNCPVLSLQECTILVKNSTSSSAVGVQSRADKLEISDVEIITNGYKATATQYENEADIFNLIINVTAYNSCNGILAYKDSTTTANNVQISMESELGDAQGMVINEGATFSVKDLNVFAVTKADKSGNATAFGVSNHGTCTIKNSIILADSKYGHTDGTHSDGIKNSGTLACHNTQSAAALSGIMNYGNLFISRCLLSGVTHGGLYTIHTHDEEVVVNDTVLEVGVYRGQFTDIYADILDGDTSPGSIGTYSGMYFGDNAFTTDGGDLYMDSCIFVGLSNEAFVVRPGGYTENGLADGKHPNRLFISRSKIAAQKTKAEKGEIPTIRLNLGDGGVLQHAFAELYIGSGCNFTVDNVQLSADVAAYVHNDDVLYRKKDQHLPTYEEYYTLMKEE